MALLQTDSHERAEARPPRCVNTTNKLQPFRHRRFATYNGAPGIGGYALIVVGLGLGS